MRIELWDSFNQVRISSHNSLESAITKQKKHLQRVKKNNGKNSYLTYDFKYSNGKLISPELISETRINLDRK